MVRCFPNLHDANPFVALFIFGYVKSGFTGSPLLRGGIQTVLVGGVAATAAFGIARLIG
ncbi:MAG: VIT1/CCC1 transporter family protein [Nitrospirae bacterium]|nr:VIT1/CCC1 transporter family protein [Nitrospirota bacterium]